MRIMPIIRGLEAFDSTREGRYVMPMAHFFPLCKMNVDIFN